MSCLRRVTIQKKLSDEASMKWKIVVWYAELSYICLIHFVYVWTHFSSMVIHLYLVALLCGNRSGDDQWWRSWTRGPIGTCNDAAIVCHIQPPYVRHVHCIQCTSRVVVYKSISSGLCIALTFQFIIVRTLYIICYCITSLHIPTRLDRMLSSYGLLYS